MARIVLAASESMHATTPLEDPAPASPLTEPQRVAALAAARETVAALAASGAGLAAPWPAVQRAIVLRAYARAADEPALDGLAEASLDRAAALCAETTLKPRLVDGFLGVAWAFELLHPTPDADAGGDEDPNAEVDLALARALARPPTRLRAGLDLFDGLVGAGVYALARPPRAAAAACLERIVYRLEELADFRDDGVAWWAYAPRGAAGVGFGYDLGLARGAAGVVALLARALARGVSPARTRGLLEGAVAWLLARRLAPDGPACFGTVVDERGGTDGPSRAAWCDGDAGVALALYAAAHAARDARWRAAALDIARHAARRAPEACSAGDATLCHGAAGLLHVFHRLYRATGDPLFRDAARRWFDEAQRRWRLDARAAREPCVDLLAGRAGVALALLAAASATAPRWDALILADLPQAGASWP